MYAVRQAKNVHLPFILVTIVAISVLVSLFAANVFAATASLSWAAPTTYTDGTPITNLGGYRVYIGTTSGSYSQNIDVGNETSYTVSSLNNATTYYFAVTAYDASGDVSGYSNQASYTTPAAPPSASQYTITASAGSNGSISPPGSTVVTQGNSQTFTITPNTDYYIASVTVDGAVVASNVMTYSYTFSDVTATHTISATFAYCTKLITVSAGANGSISPGSTYVDLGSAQTFAITPNTDYYIASVTVDGAVVASNVMTYSYTFSDVTATHTISATFGHDTELITVSAGANGSISPGPTYVNLGSSQTFKITPNSGRKISAVTVDGKSVGAVSSYTFSDVTKPHSISATFK